MKVEKTRREGDLTFTITIERKDLEAAKRKAAKKLARELRIPGFRPGKAPYQVVVRYLGGEDALLHEVVEQNFISWITKALEPYGEEIFDVELAEEPDIQGLEAGSEEITITFTVPGMPQATLGDVSSIEVEEVPPELSEEEVEQSVEEALMALREEHATWIPASGPAEYGDLITIDLEGRLLTGETVVTEEDFEIRIPVEDEDEEEEPSPILVAGQETQAVPPERFWSQIVGMSVGQTREFSIAYPEDWSGKKLAGRTVFYRVTLKDLKKAVLPAVDDELAQMVGDFETIEELRSRVREQIETLAEQEAQEKVREKLFEKLVEISEVDYSPKIVQHHVERLMETFEDRLRAQGTTLEEYLDEEGLSPEEYEAELREAVETALQYQAVLDAYVESRGITASPSESLALFLLEMGVTPESLPKEMLSTFASRYHNRVLRRKALKKLMEEVTGEEQPPLPEETIAASVAEKSTEQEEQEPVPATSAEEEAEG